MLHNDTKVNYDRLAAPGWSINTDIFYPLALNYTACAVYTGY